MGAFATMRLPVERGHAAPDGSDARVLLGFERGGMAHCALAPGAVSTATTHRTAEEIWFFLGGRGEMWRRQGDNEAVVPVEPGDCLTIPLGTHFQFRSFGDEPLAAIAVTMPPWPGADAAVEVTGKWAATV